MQQAQVGARLDPDVVHEPAARSDVGVERFALPARAVQRQHPLRVQTLSQWVLLDQPLEPEECLLLAAGGQIGVDGQLARAQPQLLEPADLGGRERLAGDIGQGRAAPQLEGRARGVARLAVVAAGLLDEALEAGGVDRIVAHPQLVAPPVRDDLGVVAVEHAPQL